MLDPKDFKKAASKSALKARRKVHALLPEHVAAAYKEAEKIAVQRANAEALHTYLGDILWQIAELVKTSFHGKPLSVAMNGEPGEPKFSVTIQAEGKPQKGVLSLGIDSVPFSENGKEPYQTLAITMRHAESARSEFRHLFYIKEGMRTLSGPDQTELCKAVNSRIDIMLAGQKTAANSEG